MNYACNGRAPKCDIDAIQSVLYLYYLLHNGGVESSYCKSLQIFATPKSKRNECDPLSRVVEMCIPKSLNRASFRRPHFDTNFGRAGRY